MEEKNNAEFWERSYKGDIEQLEGCRSLEICLDVRLIEN